MPIDVEPLDPNSDERLWAMLAHLFGLLGYVSAVGQYVAPLIIYLAYRNRSMFVAFHALQSLYFQLALLLMSIVGIVLTVFTCGLGAVITVPLGGVVAVGALVYVLVAAMRAYDGEWFEYWIVGRWAREQLGLPDRRPRW